MQIKKNHVGMEKCSLSIDKWKNAQTINIDFFFFLAITVASTRLAFPIKTITDETVSSDI